MELEVSVGSLVSAVLAGSSATATVPTVCSDAWSVAEVWSSGSGAVPPICCSVKGLFLLFVDVPSNANGPSLARAVEDDQLVRVR